MPKRTFKPNFLRKLKKQGFRARNCNKKGKLVLKKRMIKGRYRISP